MCLQRLGASVATAHKEENPHASICTRSTRGRGGREGLAGEQIVQAGNAVRCDGPSGGGVVVGPQGHVRHHVSVRMMELEVIEIGGEGRAVPVGIIECQNTGKRIGAGECTGRQLSPRDRCQRCRRRR
jgi:hypothetical protein